VQVLHNDFSKMFSIVLLWGKKHHTGLEQHDAM